MEENRWRLLIMNNLRISNNHRRILIVEPDSKLGADLFRFFHEEGFDVDISQSFSRAREKVENIQFPCVIMDVCLPEMENCRAIQEVNSIDPQSQIVLVGDGKLSEFKTKESRESVSCEFANAADWEDVKLAVSRAFDKFDNR